MKKTSLNLLVAVALFAGDLTAAEPRERKIEERVRAALQSDPALRSYPLQITVITNRVVIEGVVTNPQMRKRADTVVATVPGVGVIDSRLLVAPEKRPDGAIQGDVKAALVHDAATEGYKIDVQVADAVVHLRGAVQSVAERELAATVAGTVRGVKEVVNHLEYKPKLFRPDHELKREILRSLEYDARLTGLVFDVEVRSGKVIIKGEVSTPAQRLRARMHAQPEGHRSLDDSGLVVGLPRLVAAPPRKDAAIADALRARYTRDPRIFSDDVTIGVIDGVVTLRGRVDHLKAYRRAELLADEISGVVRVYNLLKIIPYRDRVLDDESIRRIVIRQLKSHPLPEKSEISIGVTGGVVRLTGWVGTEQEKWAASEAASVVRGVVEVRNRLKVLHPRRYSRPGAE